MLLSHISVNDLLAELSSMSVVVDTMFGMPLAQWANTSVQNAMSSLSKVLRPKLFVRIPVN
jgi:NAD(P)H-hydrate repair Nnr-like enzyme with NAD(P)H-hydrate epimerase domain